MHSDCPTRVQNKAAKPTPRETSQILPKIFAALYEEGINRSHVARALCIPQSELEQLLFGLALASLDGAERDQAEPGKSYFGR